MSASPSHFAIVCVFLAIHLTVRIAAVEAVCLEQWNERRSLNLAVEITTVNRVMVEKTILRTQSSSVATVAKPFGVRREALKRHAALFGVPSSDSPLSTWGPHEPLAISEALNCGQSGVALERFPPHSKGFAPFLPGLQS